MVLVDISQSAPAEQRAVIINAGTKLVTTLSLLSVLRHANMPVLLIDCQSTDGSWEHFIRLMERFEFDLLSAPLRPHGQMLDWLFQNIRAQKVLLVDSDLELLNADVIRLVNGVIDAPPVFGGGFTHGPCWLADHPGIGYYQERMWMPLTMLKVACVRQALDAGRSFMARRICNDCAFSEIISHILAQRFRFRTTRNWRLSWLNWLKGTYYGQKPCYVVCDTGALIYQFLKYDCGLYFVGFPAEVQSSVKHLHGVTRSLFDPDDKASTNLDSVAAVTVDRLKQVYGFDWPSGE